MPEHFHLLLEPTAGGHARHRDAGSETRVRAARGLCSSWRVGNSAQANLFEHVARNASQVGFYDFNALYGAEAGKKITINASSPGERGLVESPELWPWSSYCAYALGKAERRGSMTGEARK